MLIKKRDGQWVPFDSNKIKRAILLAMDSSDELSISEVDNMVQSILEFVGDSNTKVEDVQAYTEQVLMEYDYHDTAREYIIYRAKRDEIRNERLKPDSSILTQYIHASKYAKQGETYEDTVKRVEIMHMEKFPDFASKIQKVFEQVYQRNVLPSMRSMQFAGEAIKRNNFRLYNCSFTLINRPEVFGQIFWALLSGAGVGYSVQWRHVLQLPPIAHIGRRVKHYSIPDTIEGWAQAIQELIIGFIHGYYVEFDYSQIRAEGCELVVSGGKAPGHIPLKNCLENIRERLLSACGRRLRPIECHDIICTIADAVLSGGIRRSSLMCLFSPEDTEMLYCKSAGMFNPSGLNSVRMMANNSAVLHRQTVTRETFDTILRVANEGFGEPGFYFTDNLDWGTNPCAEIGLRAENTFGVCNLTEVNCATVTDEDDFVSRVRAAAAIGTLQAAYTDFKLISPSVARADALLGVSLTGMMDNPDIAFNANLLKEAARAAKNVNLIYAETLGINPAKRITCVKPSGTASLLLGCIGSGIHPHHARRYFRRVTGNRNEPIVKHMLETNPHMCELKPNGDYAIVFPVEAPSNAITLKDMSAEEFLCSVMLVYDNWIRTGHIDGPSHNVSCTVTLKEGENVNDMIWDNRHRIGALSFVPETLDKLYPFAPREAITTRADEKRWNDIVSEMNWIPFTGEVTDRMHVMACEGDKCEIN